MDYSIPIELEELVLCSCCHLPFNEHEAAPKLFSCRHYFCLKCATTVLMKGTELYCIHCWKRTELPAPDMKPENLPTNTSILYLLKNISTLNNNGCASVIGSGRKTSESSTSGGLQSPVGVASQVSKGENCLTHAMPNSLWCLKCNSILCRGCASTDEHRNHPVKPHAEAKEAITNDIATELLSMQKSVAELQHFVFKQRDFLLKILEACIALKTQIETELINHLPTYEVADMRESLMKAKVCLSMLEQQSPVEAFKLHNSLNIEKQRLQSKHTEMLLKCKLDDLIRNYGSLFDFEIIKQAIINITSGGVGVESGSSFTTNALGHGNSILLLANYTISQLYSRHVLTAKHTATQQIMGTNGNHHGNSPIPSQLAGHLQFTGATGNGSVIGAATSSSDQILSKRLTELNQLAKAFQGNFGQLLEPTKSPGGSLRVPPVINLYVPDINGMSMQQLPHLLGQQNHSSSSNNGGSPTMAINSSPTLLVNPTLHVYPIFYFNIEINGQPFGRILIEVRSDVAPKMAKNFGALATGELGFGYKGCTIFQCWENESIITGDFELNNGRGGRSVFEESFFMPDDTKILAIRGSVGMRRSQKRHDNMGLVGSQFRIILREMRGFTGIFAFVIEGLDLVEKISQAGDSAGKPQSNVVIVSCGKLQ